jgi:hypothetical protein
MSRRRIGQETFGFGSDDRGGSSLDDLLRLVDWAPVDRYLAVISNLECGDAMKRKFRLALKSITNRSIASAGGSRKSLGRGNAAMGYDECADGGFQKLACKFVSPPSPTI